MTDITNEKLDELESVARAASPSPWDFWTTHKIPGYLIGGPTHNEYGRYGLRDAMHIATADPATVLAMVGEVRRLRRWLDFIKDVSANPDVDYGPALIMEFCQYALGGEPAPSEENDE